MFCICHCASHPDKRAVKVYLWGFLKVYGVFIINGDALCMRNQFSLFQKDLCNDKSSISGRVTAVELVDSVSFFFLMQVLIFLDLKNG